LELFVISENKVRRRNLQLSQLDQLLHLKLLQQLRDQAAPDANRQAVALRDRLFGRGTLGSTGGAAEQEAFLNSQNQADLQCQMTAFGRFIANLVKRTEGTM
jgi:hypothetical protein